jgi:PKD repeat protein
MGSAAVGGAFYTGSLYPAEYQGAYFWGDFARRELKTLRTDASDALVPGSVTDFASEADGPVAIEMGPDGRIYYLAITTNELRRIEFTAGNTPPTANASATPTAGNAPLTVSFSSTGSLDPDGDPITFEWSFGDGTPNASGASVQHTYTANGTYVATLTVRDNNSGVGTDTVTITVGNLPPIPTITTPAASLLYKVGDVISYSGSATNQPGDGVPGFTLSWQIVQHHCPGGACHTHPVQSGSGSGGSFTVLDHGDESHFEIILTAIDPGGLSNTVSRTIQPQTVQLTLTTNPAGLQVVYDGTSGLGPLVKTTIVGSQHAIFAPTPQGASNFVSWSDGGANPHNITMGTANITRTATFSGNLAPVASISTPAATLKYKVGDVVSYSGSATSPPGDAVPGATLTWEIKLTQCPGGVCQTQVHATSTGSSGSFTVPQHGDGSSFEIILTATDSGGLSHTVSRTILPQTVQLTVTTNPAGLQVTYDGITGTAPLVRTAVVGGTRAINAPSPQGANSFTSWSDAGAQQHNVTVGTANATYTATYTANSCPVGQFRAQYYNNVNLTGTAVLTRCEAYPLNYNWGSGGPGSGVNTDNFSARWLGRFNFTAGSYTFTTRSDDGVRLWVDGVQLIDFWTDHGATTRTATRTLTAGEHEVKVEYYERTLGAIIQVSWAGGGGGSGTETNVTSQAQDAIARVPNSIGGGWDIGVIHNGDKPPVGSGDPSRQYDSYDGDNAASEDWVGYTFAAAQTFTKVVFQEGIHFWDGGWFTAAPIVQVRQNGTTWVTVSNLVVAPAYPGNNGVNFESFTMTFSQIQGDAIRIYGVPGGSAAFVSVGELEVFALVP